MLNEISFSAELQNVFLTEAEELTDQIETAILQLEATPSDFSKIDFIFRFVHTIKGSAAIAGFGELAAFTHGFEALLATIRTQKPAMTSALIDILLKGNDTLKLFHEALRNDPDAMIDTKETTARIQECLGSFNPTNADPVPLPKPPPSTAPNRNDRKPVPLQAATPSPPNPPTPDPINKPIFLVCDDDEGVIDLIGSFLTEVGFDFLRAKNGKEAIEIFKKTPVDGVFTDYMMPDLNGIEFVTAIRRINEFVPIVFVSGHTGREELKDYLKLGVLNFLEKPFTLNEISTAANQMIRHSELQTSLFTISRISFRIMVTIEKLLTFAQLSPLGLQEKERLDAMMEDLRVATTNLRMAEQFKK